MDNIEPYVLPEMSLTKDEDVYLAGVVRETYQRMVPSSGSSNYTPESNNTIEINFSNNECINWQNSYLNVDVAFTGTNASNASFTWVPDCFQRVELYIDGKEVIQSVNTEVRKAMNLLLLGELNKNYLQREAQVLMGCNLVGVGDKEYWSYKNSDISGTVNIPEQSKPRTFSIPMWVIHFSFLHSKIMPVLGSSIRLVLHLSPPKKCMNYMPNADNSYKIDNVHLNSCIVTLSPKYKEALLHSITEGDGYKINMFDLDVATHNVNQTNVQNLLLRNEHRDAKTLLFYLSRLNRFTDDTPNHPEFNTPLATITDNFRVDCGRVSFTGINGSNSLSEHFVHLERASGTFSDLEASNAYNYKLFKGYGDSLGLDDEEDFAVSPLVVSLEKIQMSDVSEPHVIGNGASAYDQDLSREIEVKLATSVNLDPSAFKLQSALVYEKTLVFKRGMITVKH